MPRQILSIIAILLLAAPAYAQTNPIEGLMSKRVITYKDAAYNAAILIPRLHKEKKFDTLADLISYTQQNFNSTPIIVPYIIITQIHDRTFKEEIKKRPVAALDTLPRIYNDSTFYVDNIFSYYLQWYKDNYKIGTDEDYPPYYSAVYSKYFEFLSSLAKETLTTTPGLTPAEKWLLNYFSNPNDDLRTQLRRKEFDGSSLKKAWQKYDKYLSSVSGYSMGLIGGLWSPTGNLSIVGNHPYIGYTIGGRSERILVDMRLDFRFIKSPYVYNVPVGIYTYTTDHFEGLNIGLDGGFELFRHKKHEFDLLGGIAWEYMGTLNPDIISNYNLGTDAGTFNSLNLNAGLGYRFFIRHKIRQTKESFSYLALQGKYNFLFFNNDGGSSFQGGAWTLGINYGFYSRPVRHYYIGI